MTEPIDIAVDLGVIPRPLPEILNLRHLVATAPAAPPQIIEGVLHQGCKMIVAGTSKSNKSWCLLGVTVIGARYGAASLLELPPKVAAEVEKRPVDFIRAAKKFCQAELF